MASTLGVKHSRNEDSPRGRFQRGVSKLTLMFFGTIFGVLTYAGFEIIPFFYYYYELVNQMDAAIRVASLESDQELRRKLMYHIRRMEIPMEKDDDLKIERSGDFMRISLPYQETFYVSWQGKDYDIHTFKFFAKAEGKY